MRCDGPQCLFTSIILGDLSGTNWILFRVYPYPILKLKLCFLTYAFVGKKVWHTVSLYPIALFPQLSAMCPSFTYFFFNHISLPIVTKNQVKRAFDVSSCCSLLEILSVLYLLILIRYRSSKVLMLIQVLHLFLLPRSVIFYGKSYFLSLQLLFLFDGPNSRRTISWI